MNGRVAKKLRRAAEDGTVGYPAVSYTIHAQSRSIRLVPGCTRKVYRVLKVAHKTGAVPDRAYRARIVGAAKTEAHQRTFLSMLASVIGRRAARKEVFRG